MDVRNGTVTSCSRSGGRHGWRLFSISRWTKEDGEKLRRHLEEEFEKGNRQIYWDDVVMFCHFDEYRLGIHRMPEGAVVEIDDIAELAAIDTRYRDYIEQRKQEGLNHE